MNAEEFNKFKSTLFLELADLMENVREFATRKDLGPYEAAVMSASQVLIITAHSLETVLEDIEEEIDESLQPDDQVSSEPVILRLVRNPEIGTFIDIETKGGKE